MQSDCNVVLAFWSQMHDRMLQTLQDLRPSIHERWEALLRAAPVTSPLANPDALIYLMDWTLDRFFATVRAPLARRRLKNRDDSKGHCNENKSPCECGMNPLLAYFATAEQALIQSVLPVLEPREREGVLSAIQIAMQVVAKREIDTFCAVCQRRHTPPSPPASASVSSAR
jgi:hypothetical protein